MYPETFDLGRLEPSEQRVCRALLDGLDDDWAVIPRVPVVDRGQDGEIDIVVASPVHGVIVIEVKGGIVEVVQGEWRQNGRPLKRTPAEQAMRSKHLLIERMRRIRVGLDGLFLRHVVALPDVGDLPATGLGPDAPREILWGQYDLREPAAAIAVLQREHGPVTVQRFARFLRALRPDIRLTEADASVLPSAARRIDDQTRARLEAVRELDANARVLVTGGAGTGKTWLVVEWARRAAARGERTVVITFNRPLADHLTWVLDGTGVVVHTYHDLIVTLLTPFGFTVADRPDRDYWERVPTLALLDRAADVGTPFDTVIVDEGQDVRPHWLSSIEGLIDRAATPPRLLMVADPTQAIYVPNWTAPAGMVVMPLVHNLRSARSVAEVVHHLGGPAPLPDAGGELAVQHWRAGGVTELRTRLRVELDRLTGELGVPLSQIAVLTLRTEVRDALLDPGPERVAGRDPLPLARWEQRGEDTALCETAHRGKGLERAAVVLVDLTDTPEPQLVYIGASRAMWSLTLIGSDALARVAGVEPQRRD
jgi:hypothetical protein